MSFISPFRIYFLLRRVNILSIHSFLHFIQFFIFNFRLHHQVTPRIVVFNRARRYTMFIFVYRGVVDNTLYNNLCFHFLLANITMQRVTSYVKIFNHFECLLNSIGQHYFQIHVCFTLNISVLINKP